MSEKFQIYDIEPNWLKKFPQWFRGLILFFAGLYCLIALIGAVWAIGEFFVALGSTAKDSHEAVRNVGIIFLAVMGAPFVIWRAIVAQGNLDRSKDRDYADLFTKAVEQLGATREETEYEGENRVERKVLKPNIEVRLGAIYALERISQDSERDHIAVMETLCAYIRINSNSEGSQEERLVSFNERDAEIFRRHKMRSDVRAALRVVGLRSASNIDIEIEARFRLSFRGTSLTDTAFEGDFAFSIFSHCDLSDSSFVDCNLRGAYFRSANLNGTSFAGADLSLANLVGTDLRECRNLSQSQLEEAFGDAETVLPAPLTHPKKWPERALVGWEVFKLWEDEVSRVGAVENKRANSPVR